MNKIALILLLGLNLVVAEAIAQDKYEDGEEIEIYEEEIGDEIATEADTGGDEDVGDSEYYDIGNATQAGESDEAFEDDVIEANTAIRGGDSADSTDITRWRYTEEEIAKKEATAKKKAQQEAEYNQSITRKRSGMFFGLGMGYSSASISDLIKRMSSAGLGLGVFVGYQQAFNTYSGIRAYGEFDYNLGKGIFVGQIDGETYKAYNTMWKALGNIDFYIEGNMGRNFTETLGLFFGIGAGYIFNQGEKGGKSSHLVAMTLNLGIHTIIGTHHRIEVFGRMYPVGKSIDEITKNADAWLRYSYMF